jgi:hypothetical protein
VQKIKSSTSGKDDASAAPSEPAPKRKKVKVLTHRPRFIEPASVPEFGGETSLATEAKEPALMQKTEETEVERTKILEVISPSAEVTVPKAQKYLTVIPKRKRMVNVLDVLETMKTSSSTPGKTAEASKTQTMTKLAEAEAGKSQAKTEAGPANEKSLETEEETEKEAAEQILSKKTATPTPEASSEVPDYIVRHASGKRLSEEEKRKAQYYAQKLKYAKGALIFNGSGEEDFLYYLPDSKEISVCWEMGKSFGFPTLEDGLSVLSKDELADNLAYNSLKVRE